MAEAAAVSSEKREFTPPSAKTIILTIALIVLAIIAFFLIRETMYAPAVAEIVTGEDCSIEHTYKNLSLAINHTYRIEAEQNISADITVKCNKCGYTQHDSFKNTFSMYYECNCEHPSHFCVVGCKTHKK